MNYIKVSCSKTDRLAYPITPEIRKQYDCRLRH